MDRRNSGVALLMVIFIIAGVAVIVAPLAYMMLAHEEEGVRLMEDSRGTVGAYGAANHAINSLYDTCGDFDDTPFSDIPSEFRVQDLGPGISTIKQYIAGFNEIFDENTTWGVTVTDLQSRINLNTITPLLVNNLLEREVVNLYSYRVNGEPGTYRLLRTVHEARSIAGLSADELRKLTSHTTVWSGPNTYGSYFSAPIPCYIDDESNVRVYTPGILNKIAPGMVIQITTGDAGAYNVYYVRITDILTTQTSAQVMTTPGLQPAEYAIFRLEVPRPVNINTASIEVMRALFTGVGLKNNSTLEDSDVDRLLEAILDERESGRIEGYNEMAALIEKTFGEGDAKTSALHKSIAWPAWDLYLLDAYTAPLCYDSDSIFRIDAAASMGSNTWGEKSRDDISFIVSVTPPGENTWSMRSQYDWQRLIDCGFGDYHLTGPNPCFVQPDDGVAWPIVPDKTLDSTGYLALESERVFADELTTFIAHFDTGTEETVFWADEGTEGEREPVATGLQVSEDDQESSLSPDGVRFTDGASLAYSINENLSWQTEQHSLKMLRPFEFECWITLDRQWNYTQEQVLFELGGTLERENRVTLSWLPTNTGGFLDLAISDAGMDEDSIHYRVMLPDTEGIVEWTPEGTYHIRAVVYKTWNNAMALFIDGKKLPGLFCNNEGKWLPDGFSHRLSNYEWTRPPANAGEEQQFLDVDGTLYPGNAQLRHPLGKPTTKEDGDGVVTYVVPPPGWEQGQPEEIQANAPDIPVHSVDGFPEQGVLYYQNPGGVGGGYEFIIYKEKVENENGVAWFKGCERGASIQFDDGGASGSTRQPLPFDGDGNEMPPSAILYLLNAFSSTVDNYPPAGYLWLDGPDGPEVIAYMGKTAGNAASGSRPCFFLDPMRSLYLSNELPSIPGRGRLGTTNAWSRHESGSYLIQMFATNSWELQGDALKDKEVTVIDNEQKKEYMTVKYSSSHWIGFTQRVTNTYYINSGGMTSFSRVLLFPSGELPTVPPENFYIGSDRYSAKNFMGSIDEVKIIHKAEGEKKSKDYQPYDLWYGRYLSKTNDTHLVLTNIYKTITEGFTGAMTGNNFVLAEEPRETPDSPWQEVVFTKPTDTNPDLETIAPVALRLNKGANPFDSFIPVESTSNFPERGYILVEGVYQTQVTDPYTGKSSMRTRHYHCIFYYGAISGDQFNAVELFRTIDDSPNDSAGITIHNTDLALQGSFLQAALVSTEVKFHKRGGLHTVKLDEDKGGNDSQGNAKGLFPEGMSLLCLRYPFGTTLVEAVDALTDDLDEYHIVVDHFPFEDIRRMQFEVGSTTTNDLEVMGVDIDPTNPEEPERLRCDFRGCYGTTPNFHSEEEVITMLPVRYLDRSRKLADPPDLRFFPMQSYMPGMRIKAITWEEDDVRSPIETQMRILMRMDSSCSWASEPGSRVDELREFTSPPTERIEVKASNDTRSFEYFPGNFVEFRIFFEWKTGAYTGNDWKRSRLLKNFKIFYERPSQILESRKSVY